MNALFFLLGATVPLANVGIEIAPGFYLNPSIVFGASLGIYRMIVAGITLRALAATIMFICFTATAIGNPVSNYALSLAALFIVLLPVVMSMPNQRQTEALLKGFIYGVLFILTFMWLEIILQLSGFRSIRDAISGQINDLDHLYRAGNFFVLYYRPYGTFSEPAHLGIFLAMSVAILDQLSRRSSRLLMWILILSVFFTGSLVGYVLTVVYFCTKLILQHFSIREISIRARPKKMIMALLVLMVAVAATPTIFERVVDSDIMQGLVNRFESLRIALITGEQVGSEGSRANAIFLLPVYWQDAGISGFLFGEGYGDHSDWLIQQFGYLGKYSTAARGQTDNIFVAVFISTGLFGFLAYLAFILSIVSSAQPGCRSLLFVVIFMLQFSGGFLLLYLNWHLPFILIVATRMRSTARKSDIHRKYVGLYRES